MRQSLSKPPIRKHSASISVQYEPPNNCILKTFDRPRSNDSVLIDEQIRALLEANSDTKTEQQLEEENRQLRKQLRDMNTLLNRILARQNVTQYAPKKITFKQKSVEDRSRTYHQEIQNNQKTLALRLDEYHKLKDRIEHIKDPTYILQLEEKINSSKQKTEQTIKMNKQIEWKNKLAGKDLNQIEDAAGKPPALLEANERARDLALLTKKNEAIREEVDKFGETNEDQQGRISDLTAKLSKLESIAEHYSVRLVEDPQRHRYEAISKEIKEHEEGLKFMLNRNDKFAENFFERNFDELRFESECSHQHLKELEEMLAEQVKTIKEMIAKETAKGNSSTRDLFSKLRVSFELNSVKKAAGIEGDQQQDSRISGSHSEKKMQSSKPPLGRPKNPREQMYKELPIYSPQKGAATKPFNIRKGPKIYRQKSPEHESPDRDKPSTDFENRKSLDNPLKPNFFNKRRTGDAAQEQKKAASDEKQEMVLEEKQQEPIVEKKPEDFVEKKPFSKPFGLKKSGAKAEQVNTRMASSESQDNLEKKAENTSAVTEQFGKGRYKGTPDMTSNYISKENDSHFESKKNGGLKLPDSEQKEESTVEEKLLEPKDTTNTHDSTKQDGDREKEYNIGASRVSRGRMLKKDEGQGLALNFGQPQKTSPDQQAEQKESQTQQLEQSKGQTFGSSRLNRNRIPKKDEGQGLVLSFGDKQATESNTNNRIKLSDENKQDSNLLSSQKDKSKNEIRDPFAELDQSDFIQKKALGLGSSEQDRADHRFKSINSQENSQAAGPVEEKKPFTLEINQGPRRVMNAGSFGQQNQSAAIGSQPLTLGKLQQPQLRFGGDRGSSVWNKKPDDSEIKTIGEERPKEGGLKLGGAGGGSIWDKKETESEIKTLGEQDSDKKLSLNFNDSKPKEKSGGLSFLNNNDEDKKPVTDGQGLGLIDDSRKPRRMKMGDKKPEEKVSTKMILYPHILGYRSDWQTERKVMTSSMISISKAC